jgi:hypothetical protein
MQLPKGAAPEAGRRLVIHNTEWGATNDFAEPIRTKVTIADAGDGFCFQCATVKLVEEGIQLDWAWDHSGGLPPRATWNAPDIAEHSAVARENEWVRARWNGRFSCVDFGIWSYALVVVNAGLCPTAEIPADFFLRTEPVDDYNQLAYLR